jgi:hypothetical protein
VTNYSQVEAAYEAARDEALSEGRQIVDTLRSDNADSLVERMSPELQELVGEGGLGELLTTLEHDRVRFFAAGPGMRFDGQLTGDTIEGYVHAGGLTTFTLQRDEQGAGDHALSGVWSGTIVSGQEQLAISADFWVEGGELQGTLDVPAFDMTDLPLEDLIYLEEAPIGNLVAEQALPRDPGVNSYWATYGWEGSRLAFTVGFDNAGTISTLQVAPEPTLPPDPVAGYESPTTFQLPFDGVWWVFWGGDTVLQNYHAEAPSQRHALDLMIWNEGSTFSGDGAENEDYWVWGQPVLGPAAGTVVEVVTGIADNTPGEMNMADHPAGNHIVLQTGEEEFVYLAHMQNGSIQVEVGDEVEAGDPIGLTGNSGNSSEPHLHIHAQNRPEYTSTEDILGLPIVFSTIVIDGQPAAESMVVQGQFVSNATGS